MAHFEWNKHAVFSPAWPFSWTLNQSNYLERSALQNTAERSGMKGEFSFQFSRLSRTTWDRNNKVLRDWSQAKIMPPGQEVCQIPCMTFILLPSTPSWKDTQSLCPGALNCHKQLGYIHYYREPHANIRLGSFLESVQHVRARLIQWEDCGKRISYAVILCNREPHQNYLPPVDELS